MVSPGAETCADERLDALREPFVEGPVPRARVRVDRDGRRAGVGGHDVPDEDTVAERVPADAGERRRIVGDRRADQRLGVEAVAVAPDIADGREALDPGDAVQPLEPLGQALDRAEDGSA